MQRTGVGGRGEPLSIDLEQISQTRIWPWPRFVPFSVQTYSKQFQLLLFHSIRSTAVERVAEGHGRQDCEKVQPESQDADPDTLNPQDPYFSEP